MPSPAAAAAAAVARRQSSRRFSVDLVVDSLPTVLVPKRLRSASLPSLPSPHNPLAVPRKSALKRPRALSAGDLPSSEPFRIQFPSAEVNKAVMTEEVKLALSLEAELVQTNTLVAEICAHILELIPAHRRHRVYSISREEHRASALRRHANLPPPADWDEIPCKVHFSVPAPPRPALRRADAEPAWCDFM